MVLHAIKLSGSLAPVSMLALLGSLFSQPCCLHVSAPSSRPPEFEKCILEEIN